MVLDRVVGLGWSRWVWGECLVRDHVGGLMWVDMVITWRVMTAFAYLLSQDKLYKE